MKENMFKASNFTHTVTVSYLSRFFQVYISQVLSIIHVLRKQNENKQEIKPSIQGVN